MYSFFLSVLSIIRLIYISSVWCVCVCVCVVYMYVYVRVIECVYIYIHSRERLIVHICAGLRRRRRNMCSPQYISLSFLLSRFFFLFFFLLSIVYEYRFTLFFERKEANLHLVFQVLQTYQSYSYRILYMKLRDVFIYLYIYAVAKREFYLQLFTSRLLY